MLYGLLVTLFVFVCFLLILVILVQQGKGGLGLGAIGGGAQMLFGGSGGQDIFQKVTWTLGAIFMLGSLGLFLLGSRKTSYSRFIGRKAPISGSAIPQAAKPQTVPKSAAPKAAPVDAPKQAASVKKMPEQQEKNK